jgi:ABC-type antimicrobial peptide transport system permease subunit
VRLALGATARRVVSQIVGETMRVIIVGAIAGWVLALVVDLHLLRGPIHLSVYGGVPAVLLIVAAAACWLPAHRAAAIDPVAALRQD